MEVPHKVKNRTTMGFPGCPVVKTLCFHCRERGLHPWLGTFHMPRGGAKRKKKMEHLKIELPYGAAIPLLVTYPKKMKSLSQLDSDYDGILNIIIYIKHKFYY